MFPLPATDAGGNPGVMAEPELRDTRALPFAATAVSAHPYHGQGMLERVSLFDTVGVINPQITPQTATPAAGADAVITVAGVAGEQIAVNSLAVSLSANVGTGSVVTIGDGVGTLATYNVPAALGVYTIPLPNGGIELAAGRTLTITATHTNAAQVVALDASTMLTVPAPQVELFDGDDATGTSLGIWTVGSGGAVNDSFGEGRYPLRTGLFVKVLAGTVRGSVWVKPLVY